MEIVELHVRMDCSGCERTIRNALSKVKGVDSVDVILKQNKVVVTGYVDRMKVLKAVRKTGKKAEFWAPTYKSGYRSYMNVGSTAPFSKTYNYEKHGYNNTYGHANTGKVKTIAQEGLITMFSDENPNSCSIM